METSTQRFRDWLSRPTVSSLKGSFKKRSAILASRSETQLLGNQSEEPIRILGTVLVEAYTPSYVRSLPRQIEKMPGATDMMKWTGAKEILAGRAGTVRYGRSLGEVVKDVADPFGISAQDRHLPQEFDSSSTSQIDFLPSLTLIVTSFSVAKDESDLTSRVYSESIRKQPKYRFEVKGRFGSLRQRIPWSRPKQYLHHTEEVALSNARREEIANLTATLTRQAQSWFYRYFKGFLHESKPRENISFPLFATLTKEPFTSKEGEWPSGILDFDFQIWESTNPSKWRVNANDHLSSWVGAPAIFAGKLANLEDEDDQNEETLSNRQMMHSFMDYNYEVIQWFAVLRLLEIYAERLAGLRDGRHKWRSIKARIFKYSQLRDFLEGDALDIVSIANEVRRWGDDSSPPRIVSPQYRMIARLTPLEGEVRRQLETELYSRVVTRATALLEDYENVIQNLRAASSLRQSISNFRIQILLMIITVATLAFTYLLWHRKIG